MTLFEILQKELRQLRHLDLEITFSHPPRFPWIENVRRNARNGCWDLKVEDFIDFVFRLGELTRVDGVENGTRVPQSVQP